MIFIALCAIIDGMDKAVSHIIAFSYTIKVPPGEFLISPTIPTVEQAIRKAEQVVLDTKLPIVCCRLALRNIEQDIGGNYIVKLFYEKA